MKKLRILLIVWLPIIAWMIYVYSHGGGYVDAFKWVNPYKHGLGQINCWGILVRQFTNAINTPLVLSKIFVYVFAPIFAFFMFLAVYWLRRLKYYRILLLYLAIFLLITWALPSMWIVGRYYLPLLPIFCILIAKGLKLTIARLYQKFLIIGYVVISLIFISTQVKQTWKENIAYLKNQEYPAKKKYVYYRGYQKLFRTENSDTLKFKDLEAIDKGKKGFFTLWRKSKLYIIRKPEIFLWIKNQER
jgi:hypothetical protein